VTAPSKIEATSDSSRAAPFNKLTAAEAEALALIMEECGEVVQIIGKILRHGLESCHPNGNRPNRELLEDELGDLRAAVLISCSLGIVGEVHIEEGARSKLDRVGKYLHHITLKRGK